MAECLSLSIGISVKYGLWFEMYSPALASHGLCITVEWRSNGALFQLIFSFGNEFDFFRRGFFLHEKFKSQWKLILFNRNKARMSFNAMNDESANMYERTHGKSRPVLRKMFSHFFLHGVFTAFLSISLCNFILIKKIYLKHHFKLAPQNTKLKHQIQIELLYSIHSN